MPRGPPGEVGNACLTDPVVRRSAVNRSGVTSAAISSDSWEGPGVLLKHLARTFSLNPHNSSLRKAMLRCQLADGKRKWVSALRWPKGGTRPAWGGGVPALCSPLPGGDLGR